MSSVERVVIVGAGLAGARAAEALRKDGFEGRVTLFGDEPERPYLRPPLSKDYLRGETERAAIDVLPEPFYADNRIDLQLSNPVVEIDPAARDVVDAAGTRMPFDRLLLATGAAPRALPVPGADLQGVVGLRTVRDADALRQAAADAERIVVIGAGWIGSEVAASLRTLDRRVVLIAHDQVPLQRVLGPEIGGVYRDLHVERGVDVRPGTTISRVTGRDRADGVETSTGERIPADLVVAGVGVRPRTELAERAGLAVGDGIEVGPTLESSVPGIFAAGDVASAWHPFYERRLRSEHWANARFQGSAVARSMLGGTAPFERLPYFYSDQYDLGMEYRGFASPSDRLVVRGNLADRQFIAFWLRDGRVVAGMNANTWDVAKPIEALIRSRAEVDAARLADPSVPIEEVLDPNATAPATAAA